MPEISFGCAAIHVYHPTEFKSGQVGFSISQTEGGLWLATRMVTSLKPDSLLDTMGIAAI
jgi:hypothetical protein